MVPAMLTPSFLCRAIGSGLLLLTFLYVAMGRAPPQLLLHLYTLHLAPKAASSEEEGAGQGEPQEKEKKSDKKEEEEETEEEQEEEKEEEEEEEKFRAFLQQPWKGGPFLSMGRNPLLIYAGHCLLKSHFPFNMASNGSAVEDLAAGCLGVAAWASLAHYLDRRGVYFKA